MTRGIIATVIFILLFIIVEYLDRGERNDK